MGSMHEKIKLDRNIQTTISCDMNLLAVTCLFALATILSLAAIKPTEGKVTEFVAHDDKPEELRLRAHLIALADMDRDKQVVEAPAVAARSYTPVVFWHGMGDTAYGSINIDRLALERAYPGMRVFSIQIGNSSMQDELSGYFANLNEQVAEACQAVLAHQEIRAAGAVNLIGFSQGAQFMRALVQRCPLRERGIRVKSFVSLGGQHQGVFGLPNCYETSFCQYIRYMLSTGAYESYVQEHLVQAQYWHDPQHENVYRASNIFLPDINNENQVNQTYRDNLLALDNLVLVMFEHDDMVVPRESSQFAFYEPGGNSTIRPLEKSPLYLQDRLGLKQLNESGRLKMISYPGNHLQYKMSWFLSEIAAKYLDN